MFEYINNTYGLNIKKDDLIIYKPDNIKLKVIGAKNAYIKAKPLDSKNKAVY